MALFSGAALKKTQLTILLLLSLVLLAIVIALSVAVGELSIPIQTTFYAVTNKLGLTAVPLNRIHETVIWDFRLSRTLLVACAMMGAILMVLTDITARTVIAPQSLPVGVVTALIGVPFFAVILYRSRK